MKNENEKYRIMRFYDWLAQQPHVEVNPVLTFEDLYIQFETWEKVNGVEKSKSTCNLQNVNVRFLLIEWINGKPAIDGCLNFPTCEAAFKHWKSLPEVKGIEHTICTSNAR